MGITTQGEQSGIGRKILISLGVFLFVLICILFGLAGVVGPWAVGMRLMKTATGLGWSASAPLGVVATGLTYFIVYWIADRLPVRRLFLGPRDPNRSSVRRLQVGFTLFGTAVISAIIAAFVYPDGASIHERIWSRVLLICWWWWMVRLASFGSGERDPVGDLLHRNSRPFQSQQADQRAPGWNQGGLDTVGYPPEATHNPGKGAPHLE